MKTHGNRYIVKYHPDVIKYDIRKLGSASCQRIKTAIEEKLMTRPETFGIPLRRSLNGHRKLRVGDYRVVFRIENEIIIVLAIMHRSSVYMHVQARV